MKKTILAIVEVLLITGCCMAAGWDWNTPMPQMPTPGRPAPPVQYQHSTYGHPAPWYAAPQQNYTRPFDNYTQPYGCYSVGGYGTYYYFPIR